MTDSTQTRIPRHLRKYIVDQNYARYTPEDQAVWRFIMRQLKNFLSQNAHESYLDGLIKTGITVDRIPKIDEVDAHLEKFGWGAVPVSGFIPPAAFMEFQSIGVLPIASDMRTLNHLMYTPAPDIVHEAAGHAPILVHPEYAKYLRQYGEVARNTIISKQDMDQYEAIRILSDMKEDPRSTKDDIAKAEERLNQITAAMTGVSEAALLSRMNWWTAEYGLIGDPQNPKIFGAGLLSSVGEAKSCLDTKVKKIPLTVDCVNFTYDITEPQPQLFVTRDFGHLGTILEELAQKLSYRRGGTYGLQQALAAQTENTVQLNSGLQMSGVLREFLVSSADGQAPIFVAFSGPCQLAAKGLQLAGQGTDRHPEGFSSPIGLVVGQNRCLSTLNESELAHLGLKRGQRYKLCFISGVVVEGLVNQFTYSDQSLAIITWKDCRVTYNDRLLFDPAWGEYDMAVGSRVTSVFGGPADRSRFGQTEDFVAKRVPTRSFTEAEKKRHQLFQKIRELRENASLANSEKSFQDAVQKFLETDSSEWLPGIELLEISLKNGFPEPLNTELRKRLDPSNFSSALVRQCLADGLALSDKQL